MGIILLDGGFVFWFFFCQLAYVNAVGTLFDEHVFHQRCDKTAWHRLPLLYRIVLKASHLRNIAINWRIYFSHLNTSRCNTLVSFMVSKGSDKEQVNLVSLANTIADFVHAKSNSLVTATYLSLKA